MRKTGFLNDLTDFVHDGFHEIYVHFSSSGRPNGDRASQSSKMFNQHLVHLGFEGGE